MIKESHRISMCVELFVPLVARRCPVAQARRPGARRAPRRRASPRALARAGRGRGEGRRPRRRSKRRRSRATSGPLELARRVVARRLGALARPTRRARGAAAAAADDASHPRAHRAPVRSAERRSRHDVPLPHGAAPARSSARPMLETLVRTLPLADETSIRAALYLARDRGRDDLREALAEAASGCKREELRGLAAAALWDASPRAEGDGARAHARARARHRRRPADVEGRGNVAWGALIRAAAKGASGRRTAPRARPRSGGFSGAGSSNAPGARRFARRARGGPRERFRSRPRGRGSTCRRRDRRERPLRRVELWADRDDDDANGCRTRMQRRSPPAARVDLVPLDGRLVGASLQVVSGGEHARLVLADGARRVRGRPAIGGAACPGALARTRRAPGARSRRATARDPRGRVGDRPARRRGQASTWRARTRRSSAHRRRAIDGRVDAPYDDSDALRVVLAVPDDGPGLDGDRDIAVESLDAQRRAGRRDRASLALTPSPCARAYAGGSLLGQRAAAPRRSTTSIATTRSSRALHQGASSAAPSSFAATAAKRR